LTFDFFQILAAGLLKLRQEIKQLPQIELGYFAQTTEDFTEHSLVKSSITVILQ
jgi:hypothetical protein